MYLQEHAGRQVFPLKALCYTHHGYFDNIGSTSLYRGIYRITFGSTSDYLIARIHVRQVATTP